MMPYPSPRILCAAITLLLVSFTLTTRAAAQGVQTGTIRGTVVDTDQRPVPGVTVTAASPVIQGTRSTITDTAGNYTLAALPPGAYEVTYELANFQTIMQQTTVLLGLTVDQNVRIQPAGVTESVRVVAETPGPIATPTISGNLTHDEIDALATPRDILGISTLAPGVTENTPNPGVIAINGAFSFDNVFMINGVDIVDNLFAQPQNLFIEDAIQETQVLSSGISAEFGRFSGGVVNAVTKSGSNRFEGSYRLNFRNPAWTTETPFEVSRGTTKPDTLQHTQEATVGGPIVRDRLWFFGSGRLAGIEDPRTLKETGIQLVQKDTNRRGELKFTGTVVPNHTLQFDFLNDPRTVTNDSGVRDFLMDPRSVTDISYPNHYWVTNYKGIVGRSLVEAQVSQRKYEFVNSGGTSTDIHDSPFLALSCVCLYNAPYFDATDGEQRNNYQGTANLTTFWTGRGRHDTKIGYEFFRSQQTGGNSQSSTSYVFISEFLTDAAGSPILDSNGRVIPTFVPGESQVWFFPAVRGAVKNVDTNSAYVQDHWAAGRHMSLDLGVRFEQVKIKSTGDLVSINTKPRLVPRLGMSYDVRGDGAHIAHVTYAQYSGRYSENYAGNSPVGQPSEIDVNYVGPAGQGVNFAPGFNLANYPFAPANTTFVSVPLANIQVDQNTKSPLTHEVTASYGLNLAGGKGYAEAGYVFRKTTNIIEDIIDRTTGTSDVVLQGIAAGTVSNILYRNSDIPWRRYQGLVFQTRYRLTSRWGANANYTLQLENDGNFEGEGTNSPAARSAIGDYPEALPANRYYPEGHLANFQRHRLRAWTIYDLSMGHFGDVSLSGLWRVDSGRTYSLVRPNVGPNATQIAIVENAGYVDEPATYDVFYSERGSEHFKGYGLLDTSVQYNVPVFKTLRPWVRFDTYNVFNNQKLIAWNTTIAANNSGPRDAFGIPTTFTNGAAFGTATGNTVSNGSKLTNIPAYPQWSGGNNGGRTIRAALGFRF